MENAIKEKSFALALRIIRLYQFLTEQKREYVISKQLLRSGTSVGAMVREAEQAESKADFVHKLSIALKEANESEYWLDLLHQSGYLDDKSYASITADNKTILKLLTSIINTSKRHSKTK
ncbi:four helix bundle protein [Geomonas paludis]|uniref:Four helix bundle protein n=1 Tax=Geomonas paludis TaxID=2740185 RepID=A0ABY4LGV9_9BACT|nr:four helix bundle protein [Geomonas paludis]UPU35722.1 four helix bundle protein [Geomonas paludis]